MFDVEKDMAAEDRAIVIIQNKMALTLSSSSEGKLPKFR